ncbi:hypothetical protein M427DRAFT_42030 [Gonapodya prolifera JEL478]|uniref:Uncharacterized protein n=1 Tax=Gonapodya prolifera (strain JEL478) TaxID=1344416 RepID=A0A139AR40_GONPJ|nr:hypothetical protein M427DRAFT_42030 [Gonapodya prolifera JEL478]|eukprot:KXS19221.1 hypothetical protein M427DRAFT_42030 [Gonapodya prolifera JEL478]
MLDRMPPAPRSTPRLPPIHTPQSAHSASARRQSAGRAKTFAHSAPSSPHTLSCQARASFAFSIRSFTTIFAEAVGALAGVAQPTSNNNPSANVTLALSSDVFVDVAGRKWSLSVSLAHSPLSEVATESHSSALRANGANFLSGSIHAHDPAPVGPFNSGAPTLFSRTSSDLMRRSAEPPSPGPRPVSPSPAPGFPLARTPSRVHSASATTGSGNPFYNSPSSTPVRSWGKYSMVLGSPSRPSSPSEPNPFDTTSANGNPFDSGISSANNGKMGKDAWLRSGEAKSGHAWVVGIRLVPADVQSSKATLQPLPTVTLAAFQAADDAPMSPSMPTPAKLMEGDFVSFYEANLTPHSIPVATNNGLNVLANSPAQFRLNRVKRAGDSMSSPFHSGPGSRQASSSQTQSGYAVAVPLALVLERLCAPTPDTLHITVSIPSSTLFHSSAIDALNTHRSSKILNFPTHMMNAAALAGLTDPHPAAPGAHPLLPRYHHATAVPNAADMLLAIFDQPHIADVEFAVTAAPGSSGVPSANAGGRKFRSVYAQRAVLSKRCPALGDWFAANAKGGGKGSLNDSHETQGAGVSVVSQAVKRILRTGGKDAGDIDFSEYIFDPSRGRRGRRNPFAFSEFSEGSDSGYADNGSEDATTVVRVENVSYDAWWWFVRFLYCGEIDGLIGSTVTQADKPWLMDGGAPDDASDVSDDLEQLSSDDMSRPGTPQNKGKFSRASHIKRVRTRTDSLNGDEAPTTPTTPTKPQLAINGRSMTGAQSSSELALLRDLYSLSRAFGEPILTAAVLARIAERIEVRSVSFWMGVAADEEKWAAGLSFGFSLRDHSRDASVNGLGGFGDSDGMSDKRKRRRSGKRVGASPARARLDSSTFDGLEVRVGGLAGSPFGNDVDTAAPTFSSPLRLLLVSWIKANWNSIKDCGVWEDWVGKRGDGWESLLTMIVEAVREVEELEAAQE